MQEEKKHIILIIDDEADTRNLVVNYLESNEGYVFYTANNGETGLEIARNELPDLILLDWQMPEMDGLKVLEKLKEDKLTQEIPVMMYTGIMTDSNSLRSALLLGAKDFLRKPIEPIEMEARITAVIQQAEHQKEIIKKERTIYLLEKKQLEMELESKKKETVDYAKFLAGKNEFFHSLIENLKDFILHENLSDSQARTMRNYINELTISNNMLKGYEQFTELFNKLHPSFNAALDLLEVSLTDHEKQMMSFVKLNLSNKEIATLMAVSLAAVEKGKYRLKQKLNLEQDVNLNDYVNSL
jgi:DNA-binding response OmpR family regulator/DNA-binding CsgD family transcriptional regulator